MKDQSKQSGGRPTVMTQQVLQKLEMAFSNGATDIEACFLADIAPATLYDYQKVYPVFSERKQGLKDMIKYRARVNIKKEIDAGDIQVSKWYLERRARDEFDLRYSVDLSCQRIPIPIMGGLSVRGLSENDPDDESLDYEEQASKA
jgi:hypothetical protein